jgi:uncharacterized protein with ATP-grasp and redox domains
MPADFELTAECLACILRQVLEACEEASKDTGLRYQAVRDAVMYLNAVALGELDHVRVGSDLHRIVRQTTGNPDPYHELKKMSNRVALEWLSKAKASVHSNLSFMDAVSIAAWGNMIDYGAMSTFESPAALIAKAMDTRIDPGVVAQFEDLVKTSRHVLYLCDNAGEIAFDKLLVSTIQTLGPSVTVAVRGGPVMNDATIDDARDVEMVMLARTITTGAAVCGIVLAESSQEFLKVFDEADLIVSKGQGNLESLVRINRKPTTVYISKVKCDPIAKRFGCQVGSTMVAIEKTGSTQHRPDGVSW